MCFDFNKISPINEQSHVIPVLSVNKAVECDELVTEISKVGSKN